MAIDKGYEIASKSVVKANPKERVGVFCKMNNHPKVIEYTELPEKMAEEIDQNGELKYGESHIMCNLFTIDAIEKISNLQLLKDDGIIIIETDEPERDINRINNMNINYKIYDLRKYGRVSLIFLK